MESPSALPVTEKGTAMKNNIDFYQHYATSDQHPKFKMLRVQFGWAGEGRFWALNNRIAQAEDCCLDVLKKYNKAAIASDLGFSLPEFEEFISFLLDDCELIRECEPGVITTDIIQENFQKVQGNREKARERKQRALEKVSQGSGEQNKSSGEQNKKVKESKVKETIKTPISPLREYLEKTIEKNGYQAIKDQIIVFFKYRQAKPKAKQYQSEKGINGLFRDLAGCAESGLNLFDCLEIAMENNWQTIKPDYFKKNGGNNGTVKHNYTGADNRPPVLGDRDLVI